MQEFIVIAVIKNKKVKMQLKTVIVRLTLPERKVKIALIYMYIT